MQIISSKAFFSGKSNKNTSIINLLSAKFVQVMVKVKIYCNIMDSQETTSKFHRKFMFPPPPPPTTPTHTPRLIFISAVKNE